MEILFENNNNHAVTLREIGFYRIFGFGNTNTPLMSHRMTFAEETIEAHGGAYFTVVLRVNCHHHPLRLLQIEAATPGHVLGFNINGLPTGSRTGGMHVVGSNVSVSVTLTHAVGSDTRVTGWETSPDLGIQGLGHHHGVIIPSLINFPMPAQNVRIVLHTER